MPEKSNALVVVQARMSSSRLPGKSLLPIGGHAVAVLCAKRAANRGHRVVVAIPDDASDDVLARALYVAGIALVRGPRDDVLARFMEATRHLSKGALVVRLTADNVFPDGDYLEELVTERSRREAGYFVPRFPLDGLPYGVGGEVFTVDLLREAAENAIESYDREHVTPWIARAAGAAVGDPLLWLGRDMAHLRCTIDNIDDYTRVADVFADVHDPIAVSWRELCERLQALPCAPPRRVPWKFLDGEVHSTMTIGAAQLGMKYGAANRTGLPADSVAEAILKRGVTAGVTAVDCARGYELAEQRVGRLLERGYAGGFKVITKLDPLSNLRPDESDESVRNAVDASVLRSCVELRQKKLDVLLLHRWEHRHIFRGAIWRRLLELRDQGLVSRLGASVYTPEAAKEALQDSCVRHLQLPFNILDWRWKRSGFWHAAKDRTDVAIHARSALLQGILAAPSKYWPRIPGFDTNATIRKLDELVHRLKRESRTDLCLAFVRAQERITSVVVGMETLDQLDENLRLFALPALSSDEYADAETYIAPVSERLLDPSQWIAE